MSGINARNREAELQKRVSELELFVCDVHNELLSGFISPEFYSRLKSIIKENHDSPNLQQQERNIRRNQ